MDAEQFFFIVLLVLVGHVHFVDLLGLQALVNYFMDCFILDALFGYFYCATFVEFGSGRM